MNHDDVLTPSLSSFWGGEGDGTSGVLRYLSERTRFAELHRAADENELG
jgi:hypothetical protein